jgi:hypothetical protein
LEAANAALQERLASTADSEQELEERALLEQVLALTVTRVDPEDHQCLRIEVYKTSKCLDALR